MDSRERILTILKGEIPDRPGRMELAIHPSIASVILGEKFDETGGSGFFGFWDFPDEKKGTARYEKDLQKWIRLAKKINLDALGCKYWSPTFAKGARVPLGSYTGLHYDHSFEGGTIKTKEDLKKAINTVEWPGHKDYGCGRILIETARKNGLAAFLTAGFAVANIIESIGFKDFCYALYDNTELIEEFLDFLVDYGVRNIRNLMRLQPDFIWVADDVAYAQGPFISPKMFVKLVMPRYRLLAKEIKCPWVFHSDGNLLPIMDSLLDLGMNAIHPLEPDSMNIEEVKRKYGNRVTLVGNLDMNVIANGFPSDIKREILWLYENVGSNGNWILSSSNSIDTGANPQNVETMGAVLSKLSYQKEV